MTNFNIAVVDLVLCHFITGMEGLIQNTEEICEVIYELLQKTKIQQLRLGFLEFVQIYALSLYNVAIIYDESSSANNFQKNMLYLSGAIKLAKNHLDSSNPLTISLDSLINLKRGKLRVNPVDANNAILV